MFQEVLAIGCLIAAALIGISVARQNLSDEAARELRLKARKIERQRRKRVRWKRQP